MPGQEERSQTLLFALIIIDNFKDSVPPGGLLQTHASAAAVAESSTFGLETDVFAEILGLFGLHLICITAYHLKDSSSEQTKNASAKSVATSSVRRTAAKKQMWNSIALKTMPLHVTVLKLHTDRYLKQPHRLSNVLIFEWFFFVAILF